jgi:hypothetical protein
MTLIVPPDENIIYQTADYKNVFPALVKGLDMIQKRGNQEE